MNSEMIWVFGLLAACVVCFVINRPRMDAVALLALLALFLSGTLSLNEALSGFSEPSIILIATFFVIGEALVRTGIAFRVGDWLVKKGGSSETRLLIFLMLAVASLGSVMSSTGVVAIFIPVVLSVATRIGTAPGRLMMPLAFAGLMSGMLTLVGTPPNMIVSAELIRAGYTGFGFFAFTPMGVIILVLGAGYMVVARHWLSSEPLKPAQKRRRRLRDLAEDYEIVGRIHRVWISAESPMHGCTLAELRLRENYAVNIISIERQRHFRRIMLPPLANRELLSSDIILVDFTNQKDIARFLQEMKLQDHGFQNNVSQEFGFAELVIPPDSSQIGKTIFDLRLRSRRGVNVIGLRRNGQALGENLLREKLKMGDTLLVAGTWKAIRLLHTQLSDFLVLNVPLEIDEVAPAARQAPFALLSLAITVVLMISGVVPTVIAALIGCLLMGLFRCIDMESAYHSINWQSLILIVGMLPFALALQKTGGIDFFVALLLGVTGDASPRIVMLALFAMTSLVGLFISNTVTAILMAPIAIGMAQQLGVSPYPFAMTVALAASAAFMTPVSSPVNTLVVGPGNYRFMDFVRIGVPFTVVVMLVCVAVLPLFFAF